MPRDIEGVTYFTQEEVDGLTGTARSDGRSTAEKHFLKDIGVESLDLAKKAIENATTLGTKVTELTTTLETERNTNKTVSSQFKALSLERAAETVGGKFKLTLVKAQQVLRLLSGVKAEEFDSSKPEHLTDLEAKFKTFLEAPENKHFVEGTGTPETAGRKPGQNAPEKETEWSVLRKRMTAVQQ